MLVGIIKDLINNVNYYTYVNVYQGKLNYIVKCVDSDKYYYLNNKEIKVLFSKIFNYNKKYLEKTNDLDVFIDDDNNKHYFKNGYENLEMFFNNNGTIALMNLNKKDNKEKIEYPKLFKVSNIKEDISLILICTLIGLNTFCLGASLKNTDLSFDNITKTITAPYHYYNNIDVNEMTDKINASTGLEEEDKDYLINEDLFNDILATTNRTRNQELREKINNVTKAYFTVKELKDENKKNWAGFYNPLQPNIVHVRDSQQTKAVTAHEFIHLLQDNNQYHFIREAATELMTEEYYGENTNSYLEEIKYLKILMEIIGPKPIFDLCFKGNTINFENKIKELLNEEDTNELLNLFCVMPSNHENINEVYKKIYDLLEKMYNKELKKDPLINTILTHPDYIKRGYFNKKYIEKCSEQPSYLYNNIKISDAIKENLIEVECSLTKIEKYTLEEFLLKGGDPINIYYSALPNYVYKNKHVVNTKTQEKYELKEAIDKGLIYDVTYMGIKVISDVTLEETIKYENTNEFKGHILIRDADSSRIKQIVDSPRFITDEKNNKIPMVEMYLLENIEPINKKFPDQFNEIEHRNKF